MLQGVCFSYVGDDTDVGVLMNLLHGKTLYMLPKCCVCSMDMLLRNVLFSGDWLQNLVSVYMWPEYKDIDPQRVVGGSRMLPLDLGACDRNIVGQASLFELGIVRDLRLESFAAALQHYNQGGAFDWTVFNCPITHERMKYVKIMLDGTSYDEEAITKWMRDSSHSPLTGLNVRLLRVDHKHKIAERTVVLLANHPMDYFMWIATALGLDD